MSEPLQPGTQWGDFAILSLLGAGGMGSVYRARDPAGREVALKVLAGRPSIQVQQRFEREAQVTAKLAHPGIVRVHSAGHIKGRLFIVYELAEGQSFEDRLEDFSREEALEVVLQVARALGFAHAQGVIHRDVKEENVLIDDEGRAKVADFGLAMAEDLERLTRSGAIVGTPHAMAPEQIAGKRADQGPPTDVWALGVLLYRVLVGRSPFQADTLSHLAVRIVSGSFEVPRAADPTITRALEAVCLRALSPLPQDRFPEAGAFAEALEAALSERPARTAALALGLLALLGLGLGLGLGYASLRPTPNSDHVALTPQVSATSTPPDAELGALVARISAALAAGEDLRATQALSELEGARAQSLSAELSAGLAQALFERVRVLLDLDASQGVDLLEAFARVGWRPAVSRRGSVLIQSALAKHDFGSLEKGPYVRLVLAAARLDQTVSPQAVYPFLGLPESLRAGSARRDPWFWFLSLRARAGSEPGKRSVATRALQEALDSDEGLLGPTCWADAAAGLAPRLSQEEGRALLEEAARRDPGSPTVLYGWAQFLAKSDPERACQAAEEALERYEERSDPTLNFLEHRAWVGGLVRLQIHLNRRPQARATWAQLRREFPAGAEEIALETPWVAR